MPPLRDRDASEVSAEAEAVFRSFLEQWYRHERGDLEQVLAAHPELAPELRRLHAEWCVLNELMAGAAKDAPATGSDAVPAPPPPELRPGSVVNLLEGLATRVTPSGRYQPVDEIGRGAMGRVLRVWDEDLRRHLAMKIALTSEPHDHQTNSLGLVSRFIEEAQVTGQLDHPGIVPVHEIGLDGEGRLFFTMRLVKGRSLKEIFALAHDNREGWNLTSTLWVMLKVCDAVAYAHDKGVIHRDLKPANIMVGRFGEVYVMDWGLARVLGRKDTRDIRIKPSEQPATLSHVKTAREDARMLSPDSPLITMDGDVVGTPCYMSPEQASGNVDLVGTRSDVYAVGAMVYQLLTGHMPYLHHGQPASPHMVLYWVREGPPRPIYTLNDRVPAELVAICEKAMARTIEARYASMAALASDLRAYLEHRVVQAYQTGAFAELKKWIVRNRGLASGLAAALLIAIVALALSSLGSRRAEQRTTRQLEEIARLSDVRNLADLASRADGLWPEIPAMVPSMQQWLDDARDLLSRRVDHERELDELGKRALPYDEGQQARDRATHEATAAIALLEDERQALEDRLDAEGDAQRHDDEQRLGILEQELPRLTTRTHTRRTFEFANPRDRWHHATLEKLVADLRRFQDPEHGLVSHVRARLERAGSVKMDTIDSHRDAWRAAIAAIADENQCPRYRGLRIKEQVGLVPLGRSPQSGLWEFAFPRTGTIPAVSNGRIQLTEDSCLVLVLIPETSFAMGAQRDPSETNFDRVAQLPEAPVHEIHLRPYFIAKYELSQGQWLAFTGANPAYFCPPKPRHSFLYPVEQVSYLDCVRVLGQMGLVLPTEAQWECAARAGTSWPWWTGVDERSLDGRANIPGSPESLDYTAPVGYFLANPFGLHDTIGNVSEWCRDYYTSYKDPVRSGDGLRLGGKPVRCLLRGGSFRDEQLDQLERDLTGPMSPSSRSRVSRRNAAPPDYRHETIGVRPARVLQP